MDAQIDLNSITAFVAVADGASFTGAAQKLGLPKSYLSRKVRELEDRLGTRLFSRTTRSVSLTDDGRHYLTVCKKALGEIEEVERSFDQSPEAPRGHLRVTCAVEMAMMITKPLVKDFLNRNPDITLELIATNSVLDLVRDQIDVAIRPSHLADPSMISLKLADLTWRFYASKKWLRENRNSLNEITDLKSADMVGFNPTLASVQNWKFNATNGKRKVEFACQPRFVASTISVLLNAVINDIGVAALPDSLVHTPETEKNMEVIFPDWYIRKESIYAVYQDRRHLPARVRALLDFLKGARLFSLTT